MGIRDSFCTVEAMSEALKKLQPWFAEIDGVFPGPVSYTHLSRNEGQNRGRLMMSLAKAYYLDGQTEKAKTTLTTAGTLLRGTSLEKVIHLTLSDLRILGNDIAAEENAGI